MNSIRDKQHHVAVDCALDEPRESTEPLAFAQLDVLELDRGREDKQHHVAVDCALDEPRESTEPLAFAQTPSQ